MVNEPRILLADEPTGNLDEHTSQEIMEIFTRLNEQGKTIVMITHETDIAAYAEGLVVFRDGKVTARREKAHESLGSVASIVPSVKKE
jgi:putative ABC transport system ATP-binding protein